MRTKTLASKHRRDAEFQYASGFQRQQKPKEEKERERETKIRRKVSREQEPRLLCADIEGKYVLLTLCQEENTLAYCININRQCDYSKDFESQSFFFSLFLPVSFCSLHSMHSQFAVLFLQNIFRSNERNLKKFLSPKWISCNHFGLHQRKSLHRFIAIIRNYSLMTAKKSEKIHFRIFFFIPNCMHNFVAVGSCCLWCSRIFMV